MIRKKASKCVRLTVLMVIPVLFGSILINISCDGDKGSDWWSELVDSTTAVDPMALPVTRTAWHIALWRTASGRGNSSAFYSSPLRSRF